MPTTSIFFYDKTFHKIKPAEKFIDALIKANLGIHFTASIRTDLLGDEDDPYEQRVGLARKMKQAGCIAVGYSLKMADEEILIAMNKLVKGKYFDEQVRILKEASIISNTSVIFGYPQETPETIRETSRPVAAPKFTRAPASCYRCLRLACGTTPSKMDT